MANIEPMERVERITRKYAQVYMHEHRPSTRHIALRDAWRWLGSDKNFETCLLACLSPGLLGLLASIPSTILGFGTGAAVLLSGLALSLLSAALFGVAHGLARQKKKSWVAAESDAYSKLKAKYYHIRESIENIRCLIYAAYRKLPQDVRTGMAVGMDEIDALCAVTLESADWAYESERVGSGSAIPAAEKVAGGMELLDLHYESLLAVGQRDVALKLGAAGITSRKALKAASDLCEVLDEVDADYKEVVEIV